MMVLFIIYIKNIKRLRLKTAFVHTRNKISLDEYIHHDNIAI